MRKQEGQPVYKVESTFLKRSFAAVPFEEGSADGLSRVFRCSVVRGVTTTSTRHVVSRNSVNAHTAKHSFPSRPDRRQLGTVAQWKCARRVSTVRRKGTQFLAGFDDWSSQGQVRSTHGKHDIRLIIRENHAVAVTMIRGACAMKL